MPIAGFQRTHLLAAGTVLALGAMFAFRSPGSAQAAANTSTPQTPAAQVVYVDQFGRPLPTSANASAPLVPVAAPAQLVPATYTMPASAAAQPIALRPAVVTHAAPASHTVRAAERRRSWTKSALVIGGSAGAGAGIGGLIGGKKGAGIGAALAGGTAALYEAIKK